MNKTLSISRPANRSGFTLVELLVVIGIIAILAGAVLGASNLALKSAKRAKAQNLASQIQTAALGYYAEYSVYPVPSGSTSQTAYISDATSSAQTWGTLVDVLCGNVSPSTGKATTAPTSGPTNTRGIAFLSLNTTDVDIKSGYDAPLNPLPPSTSNPYFNIAMDADYAGLLGAAPSTFTAMPNFAAATGSTLNFSSGGTSTAGVAVWANCTGKPNSTTCNPNWWVHTY